MADIEVPEGVEVEDPRPIAKANPYTFFMPHAAELAALAPGDAVKAIFRQVADETEYEAERMWVLIDGIEDGVVTGTLGNEPAGMDRIGQGDRVRIPLSHAIGTSFQKDHPRPDVPQEPEFWDRCLVDACVIEGRSRIDYLYREEPDMARAGDRYPDSGWRIRGTEEAMEEDEKRGARPKYVALGKVLNVDDGWLHLVDRAPSCAFRWDPESETYAELR